jgi:hypothetical protein
LEESVPEPKVEEPAKEEGKREVDHSKIDKINFLLGLNQEESDSGEEEEAKPEPKEMIQFTKVYLKKFTDHNKTK